ncbi:MAG TPA: class I SAM-dependent methyltransferase [Burkholderiaceae bacterium]
MAAFYRHAYKIAPASIEEPYHVEERLDDLEELQDRVAELAEGQKVLELGCGTGYWTEILAEGADEICATDLCADALTLAATRELDNTEWMEADAYAIPDEVLVHQPKLLFAAGLWPQIPREVQESTLKHWRARLGADTHLVLIGESYVEGVSATIARTDLQGNTFQIQVLPDGSRTEVMYNFPSDSTLRKRLAPLVRELRVTRLEHYWMLTCRLK